MCGLCLVLDLKPIREMPSARFFYSVFRKAICFVITVMTCHVMDEMQLYKVCVFSVLVKNIILQN